jgi:ribosome maturation protein Sdo1
MIRRIIQKSPLKDYDILKSLGEAKVQYTIVKKIQHISKQVYDELDSSNPIHTHPEPVEIQKYIDEVLRKLSMMDSTFVQRRKDRASD